MSERYDFIQDYRKTIESYEIRDEGLCYAKGDREFLVKFTAIRAIQLRYFPGRVKTNQYEAKLDLNNGMKLRISSVSFQSFGDFRDQADQEGEDVQFTSNEVVIDMGDYKVVITYSAPTEKFEDGLGTFNSVIASVQAS